MCWNGSTCKSWVECCIRIYVWLSSGINKGVGREILRYAERETGEVLGGGLVKGCGICSALEMSSLSF